MQIAIIGSGQVGSAIARGLSRKGHAVSLGVRDPGSPRVMALAATTGAAVADPASAARGADIVLLALPWRAAADVVTTLGALHGKIVIDCMNPLGMVDGALGLILGHSTSGAEMVQGWLPHARVVKTLNQVGAEIMADTSGLPARPVMFMAGNDPAAKEAVAQLLDGLGFDPLDAGNITRARLLEPFGMLWINQAMMQAKGRDWAFATIDRAAKEIP